MKTFLRIALLLMLAPLAISQTVSNQYKHINTGWIPPAIGAAANTYPACNFTGSPAVNTLCVNGYREDLTPPAAANASSVTVLPCTATQTTACIPWGVSSYSWTPGGFLYSGTWNVAVSTAYLDANGVQQYSAPLTGTVNVPNPSNPPSGVTGLTVTVAP